MITEFHKENLRKHIKFLRDNANKIRNEFDMYYLKHSCGTPSCSLGWATVSVRPLKNHEDESQFVLSVFGVDVNNTTEAHACHFMFGSPWTDINNTPEAAAARMEAFLYNQIPEGWGYAERFAHPIVIIHEEILEPNLERV